MNQKILFICEGQLGDLLILTPAIRGMKKSFPGTELSVMIVQRRFYFNNESTNQNVLNINPLRGTSEVLLNNPFVDKIIEVNRSAFRKLKGTARLKAEWKILKHLRREKYSIVICTFPEDRFVLWAYLSGAKMRVGQKDQSLSYLLTHKPGIKKEEKGVLKYYCELASVTGAQITSRKTEFYINAETEKWADNFLLENNIGLKNIICIHPGASGYYNIWAPERFAGLYDKLKSADNIYVLLCGTKFDEPVLFEIKKYLKTKLNYVDLSDSIDRFAAILKRSALCISNDSGPRHLAVAVGTPTVSIMSRMKHLAWKIYDDDQQNIVLQGSHNCEYCSENDCREIIPDGVTFGAECIRTISVDEVFHQASKILKNRPGQKK
jgi:heptosyltransferase-2